MNIALVCFSYDKDEELFWYTSQARNFFNKNNKYNIDLYLINDLNHPVKKIPDDCIVINSSVNRGFNINGLNFIKEEYKIFKNIINNKKYDLLIKVDSDTWINNLDWIDKIDTEKICDIGIPIYSKRFRINFISGCCYILTIPTINYLYELINSNNELLHIQLKLNGIFPEDVVKSYILRNYNFINLNKYNFCIQYKTYIHPYDYTPEEYILKTNENREIALDRIKKRYFEELENK